MNFSSGCSLDEAQHNQGFSQPLLSWYEQHGRKNLPWQSPLTAYRVWISEIMLQQTQVQTVIPFFKRFMNSFPDIIILSKASEDAVLAHWSGLGYYSRARNLHKTAKIIAHLYQGQFPDQIEILMKLPGIGASTAAAIASLAFNQATAILDTNVKRVLARYFLVEGIPTQALVHKKLWELATLCMPKENCAAYTQAIMDLGALCCLAKEPLCLQCPLEKTCQAKQQNLVEHYPFKAPKKIRPVQKQQFLLCYSADKRIYLEKRPSNGIWGGLWCMPVFAWDENLAHSLQTYYGFQVQQLKPLIEFKHSFTHFHLLVKAFSVEIVSKEKMKNPGNWFQIEQCDSLGLAKPVRKIIDLWYETQGLGTVVGPYKPKVPVL